MQKDLLTRLEDAQWQVGLSTFGSSHSTLIGLIISWWINEEASQRRFALDGGPAFDSRPRSVKGKGQCDAILVEGDKWKGVIEVEKTRTTYTIQKIGNFFKAAYPLLTSIEFGIFLAYAPDPKGRKENRAIASLPLDEFVDEGKKITKDYEGKQLVILVIDKVWEPQKIGFRSKSDYYGGRPTKVRGSLVENGKEVNRCILAPKNASVG